MKVPNLILSTIILFLSNLVVRVLGFLYKIFLSRSIDEIYLGMYYILFNFLMICIAFTTTGIPTALSCHIANKKALRDKHGINVLFISSLYIAFSIAFIISILVSFNSGLLSLKLLKISNLNIFVLAICPAIVLITISNILRAYYYGLSNVVVPAVGQIVEQIVRILFVLLTVYYINNQYLSCYVALLGISVGEVANILFIIFSLYKDSNLFNKYTIIIKDFYNSSVETLKMSLPITCNRMATILINSISSIIIPSRLALSGITYSESLSIYGVISGMVIPLVYLPLTLGSALIVNLIPSISQDFVLNNHKNIITKTKYSLFLSFVVGTFCSIVFYFFSDKLCLIMFNNKYAGIYLKSMSLVPLFIILDQTLSGILQSVRKELICSIITIFGMLVQLFFIYTLLPIPSINIYAYTCTVSIVSLSTCLLHSVILIRFLNSLKIRRLK